MSSQVAVELDTRTSYAWSATFGHGLLAAPMGANFLAPPAGHDWSLRRSTGQNSSESASKGSNVISHSRHPAQPRQKGASQQGSLLGVGGPRGSVVSYLDEG